jgi:hypothetical protein
MPAVRTEEEPTGQEIPRPEGAGPAYAGLMAVEMEPEGILLHLLDNDAHTGGEPGTDSSLWHVADAERARTWCGIDVGYGKPRRRWSETPEAQRCQICVDSISPKS